MNLNYINLNYIILGIIIFVLILDIIFDFLRKKFDFLPEKGGQRFFLYFIYLFPLIITVISPVKNEFNISDSIKEYMSFYATALTITYTVYTFNKQQEKFLEEKQKENEIKEKELEAKKDYYRPIFVIETDNYNNKSVKLLMKAKDLCLEKIMYTTLNNSSIEYRGLCKHGEIITSGITNDFLMTAETIVGEIIFFGYIDRKKIYKYVKTNPIPYPTQDEDYAKDEFYKVWSSFNTYDTETDTNLESLFFKYTYFLRLNLHIDDYRVLSYSLQTETLKDFFDKVFKDLHNYVNYNRLIHSNNSPNNIHTNTIKILELFTKELGKHKSSFKIDPDKLNALKSHINTARNIVNGDYSNIIHSTKNSLSDSDIIEIITKEFLPDYLNNNSTSPNDCLEYFQTLFKFIEFNSYLDNELPRFKEIALINLK